MANVYKKDIKKNSVTNIAIIILISVFVCAVSIAGGELDYAGNDDTYRNLVSVGAFGNQFSYYLPFSNAFFGLPIAILNKNICVNRFLLLDIYNH